MKKLLVVLLTLALCVTSLASCDFLNNLFGEKEPEVTYNAAAAADYVYNLYKNKSTTAADFEVTAIATVAGVKHTVEWSVNTDKVTIEKKNDTTYIVNVDEESPEELQYVLTATVKGGDQTATKTFNLTVPKYVLWSHEDYLKAESGTDVVIKGIVVGMNSISAGNKYNYLYLADTKVEGGYYVYKMEKDPIADFGVEVGMTIEVSGKASPYSGLPEITEANVRIIDSNKTTVNPVDITAKFAAGEDLAAYCGTLVTIKGVELGSQELDVETSQYLNFKLGEKKSYLRTYVTDFPTTLKKEDKATIDAAHAEHFGWEADVTGILTKYNGTPYIIPVSVDCFNFIKKIEKTPEQKIADTFEQLKIDALFNADTVIDLPATGAAYTDVVLTWATSDATNAAIADGKLTIKVPDTAVEVTITVTATCGDKTDSKTFKLTLTKMLDFNTFITLPQANTIGLLQENNKYTEGKYFVTGKITEIKDTKYGNLYIEDENGVKFYVYGVYSFDGAVRFDAMDPQPKVGDTVVLYGAVGTYNGSEAQMKNSWLITTPAADSEITIPGANALGLAQGHDKYTEGKYSITGEITEIASTKYGNMTIKDEKGNTLYLYGLYVGETRYDSLEVKPVVGDTITIYGIVGQYKGTAQVKNGQMTKHTPATPDQGGEEGGDNTDTPVTPAGNTVDMASFSKGDGKDTSYVERTNSQGWTAVNAAAINGKEYNGATTWAITLNGKVGAAGKLTSATLAGGLKSVSFKYGFPFSDTQVKLTINVKQGDTVVATKVLERTDLVQNTIYDFTWTLDTAVEGEFTIEIINECLSASSKNKDRLSIWDLTWEGK